jgi:DNA-binding response OmpR family regulator
MGEGKRRKKILIVDDDEDFVEAVSSFLETKGYEVLKAHDGRHGLTLAKLERPDLMLVDIIMSERTEGFFAIQEIRRTPELSAAPVFVLSSLYSDIADFRVPPESGWLAHDEFFSKPVDMERLLERIRSRLGDSATTPGPGAREAGT